VAKLINVFLLYVLIVSTLLFGADLNTTIVNGDKSTYVALYKQLLADKKRSDEVSLQKTLLNKLIKLSELQKPLPQKSVTLPNDRDAYLHLFNTYLDNAIQTQQLTLKLQNNSDKIKTLHSEIEKQKRATLTTELFYTLYTKEQHLIQMHIDQLKSRAKEIKKSLIKALPLIRFDTQAVQKLQQKLDTKRLELEVNIQQLRIKKERYTLLEQSKNLQMIEEKLQRVIKKRAKLHQQELGALFLHFSIALKNKEDAAFTIHKEIVSFVELKMNYSGLVIDAIDELLSDMEKHLLGAVAAFQGKGLQEFQIQVKNLWDISNQTLFTINKTSISIFKLTMSVLIFIFGFIIGSFYKREIKKLSLHNSTLTSSTRILLANLGYYAIFIITFFIVLKVLGIDLSSIALVAGALSVGIGFGLQNIISNFVSGIILMVERSVKIGDYIQLDENLRGHVTDIKMRSITVNTNSNIDVIIPNQDLIQNRVINWTMNDKIRRFEIPFGVAYGTDPQKVIDVILKAVEKSNYEDVYVSSERYTRVIMTGMGDSSVDFELFVWVAGHEVLYPKRTTSRFLVLIYNTLYENGIEIPFPQQDLHIRSVDGSLPVSLQTS